MNIESLKLLFNDYVTTKILRFLLTYKLSQDPLENFFNSIRASLGYNNNPTVYQFLAAFRRLLAGAMNKSEYGNCVWDDTISLLVQQPLTAVAVEEIEDEYDLHDDLDLELREKNQYKNFILNFAARLWEYFPLNFKRHYIYTRYGGGFKYNFIIILFFSFFF